MKKKLVAFFLLIIFLFICTNVSIGASSTTYLYLDSLNIENENIEILSDEILIDTTTSKVENLINLKNSSDNEVKTDLVFPLENNELGISIKDLVIKLNDVQVDYAKDSKGNYTVKTKLSANSGKKIHVEYSLENDLQKARFIKCNFDNFKGKKVGKLKVDIKLDDKNIPLVEKIYPGHYTFKDNTISVEYYNYEVNTLTKNIIVKKETFYNLLYGRESSINDEDLAIIKQWYTSGDVSVKNEYYSENSIVCNIMDYKKIKSGATLNSEPSEPLLYEMSKDNSYASDVEFLKRDLKDKNVCIDFVETEDGKDLYVEKVVDEIDQGDDIQIINGLVKRPERAILQLKGTHSGYMGKRGAKIIFVDQGIDGECLHATEQEKISYINQINADMYIRIEIYDGAVVPNELEWGQNTGWVGYYDDNNLEIAKNFTVGNSMIEKQNWNGQYEKYKTYEDYVKNYKNDYCKDRVIKLDNEDISNKCEVPTVVQFIGNRELRDGKYVVNIDSNNYGIYDNYGRGLVTTNAALQTAQAQKMLSNNKQKNANTKAEIDTQIANLSFIDDEQQIQQDIKDDLEKTKKQEELEATKENNNEEIPYLKTENIIVFSAIGLGIFFCIVIIIFEQKKKN